MPEHWAKNDFRDDEVQFEPYTNLRFLFFGVAIIGVLSVLICLFGFLAEQRWEFLAAIPFCILAAWISLRLQSQLHEIYRVTATGIWFDRTFMDWRVSRRIAEATAVHRVIVDSKPRFALGSARRGTTPPTSWTYGLALVLRRGKIIRLTEADESDFKNAVDAARRLANRCRLIVDEPSPETYVRIIGREPPEIIYEKWKPRPI